MFMAVEPYQSSRELREAERSNVGLSLHLAMCFYQGPYARHAFGSHHMPYGLCLMVVTSWGIFSGSWGGAGPCRPGILSARGSRRQAQRLAFGGGSFTVLGGAI